MRILITGGAGYIGSHTCLELLNAGHDLVVVDNLSNGHVEALERVQQLAGATLSFVEGDIRNAETLSQIFTQSPVEAVIHFAALKAVGESVAKPLEYYSNNVAGTLTLLETMRAHGCRNLVYSSSCTVYGEPKETPIVEDHPIGAAECPYGWSKIMTEQIMMDAFAADPSWNFSLLRYFNPVGAHASGKIGEDPTDIPNNLMPYITQVAVGKLEKLRVFGNDYPTHDGTGVRDYLHVVDLAKAHLMATAQLAENPGLVTFNLGTGKGSSVLDVVQAFEEATGIRIPYEIVARRAGDVTTAYADPSKAADVLGWRAEFNLVDMCRDGWNWQRQNPNGYGNS